MTANIKSIILKDFPWISARKIPNKIPRSSTAILEALSATVGNDPTGTHYKYLDDPFLIPVSNLEKRSYALSKEAGRKAARWVRQEQFELFQHKTAQPLIKEFIPMTKKSNELNLKEKIAEKKFPTAIYLYKNMVQNNEPIPDDMKRDMLEILCFYNDEQQLPVDFAEDRWYAPRPYNKSDQKSFWNDNGLADRLFAEIEPKDGHAYNCIIQGMCRFSQGKRAHELYAEALEQNIDLDVNTHNAVIRVAGRIKDTNDLKWDFAVKTLQLMADKGLHPNVDTLTSVLRLVSTIGNQKFARNLTLQTLAEFKRINIMPSLDGWNSILNVFCRDRGPAGYCIADAIDLLEKDPVPLQNKTDAQFFVTAIAICCTNLNDLPLAKRIYQLLDKYDFVFGDTHNESNFYRYYIATMLSNETPEEFFKFYNSVVPNVITPEPTTMLEILQFIQMHGEYTHLPHIWTDIVAFDYGQRAELIKFILQDMLNEIVTSSSAIDNDDVHLLEQLIETIWDVWSNLQKLEKSLDLSVNSNENLLKLLCKGNNYTKALEIFTYLCKSDDSDEHPKAETLEKFVHLSLNENNAEKPLECLQFMVKHHYVDAEKNSMADQILAYPHLTKEQKLKLDHLKTN